MATFADRNQCIAGAGDIEQHGFGSKRHMFRILNVHARFRIGILNQQTLEEDNAKNRKESG
jgi:hypothetical protein